MKSRPAAKSTIATQNEKSIVGPASVGSLPTEPPLSDRASVLSARGRLTIEATPRMTSPAFLRAARVAPFPSKGYNRDRPVEPRPQYGSSPSN